jgi:uncharacterized protein (TIGR02246 family)
MSDTRAHDEVAIQAVLVDSYGAWEAGDADGMVANYTADATAVLPGSLREGREVIRENMALAFAGPLEGSSTYNKQLSLRFLGSDAAIAISESGILFAGETEVPDERRVNATWAFEHADVEGLKRLLTEDVVMEMPPMLNWFAGPHNYGLFMDWVFTAAGTDWSLKAVTANGQPGFAAYRRIDRGYELHTLQIFTVTATGISRNSVFQDAEIFASFGLATGLDAQGLF